MNYLIAAGWTLCADGRSWKNDTSDRSMWPESLKTKVYFELFEAVDLQRRLLITC